MGGRSLRRTVSGILTPARLGYLGVYTVLSLFFCWPLFRMPLAEGTGDWDQHLFYYASVLHNAAFGQLPLWNPWYCGGNVLWQNPQVSLISPVYFLSLAMPLALAMKLNVIAHYIAGCLGMHLLVRRATGVKSPAVVIYLVSLFVFCGAMAIHLEVGHSDFLSVFWLPWMVYFFWRATEGHAHGLILAGVLVGVSILNGGPHAVPLAAVLLGCLGVGAMLFGRTVKPLVIAIGIVLLGCLYAAPRLIPSWYLTKSADFYDTRSMKHPDAMSLEMLKVSLFDSSQGTHTRLNRTEQLYGWQEYGNYLGWFGAGLTMASAAVVLGMRRRRERWREASAAFAVFIVLVLTAGEFATYAPATVMNKLPLFSSFRIPSRHTLLLPLLGALCTACLVRLMEGASRYVWLRRLVDALCVVAVLQLVLVNRQQLENVFILPPADSSRVFERVTPRNEQIDLPRIGAPERVLFTNMLGSMLAGVSTFHCWEPLQLKKVARLGPAAIEGGSGVSITGSSFSPNRIAASVVVASAPARVVLNQNFSEGWSSTIGTVERDPESGRPSVLIPANYTGEIAFRFFPRGLWLGLTVWLVTVAASVLAWRRVTG